MGFSEDHSDHNRKWVIAGISLRAPLKPIYTSKRADHRHKYQQEEEEEEEEEEEKGDTTEECSRTPTGEESKVPAKLACPPAPRKRKPSLKCNGSAREFFTPPDLETVFIRRHVERAN